MGRVAQSRTGKVRHMPGTARKGNAAAWQAEAVWPLYAIVVFSAASKEQGRKRWKSRHRN